jgi:4-carboxymuconolactone decarboxylase
MEYQGTLRKLAVRDDRFIDSVLARESAHEALSPVDRRTVALVKLAALVTLDAAPPSYMNVVEEARSGGATAEEIVDVLVALMPIVGVARVVSAAPNLGLALGYDVAAALEQHEDVVH